VGQTDDTMSEPHGQPDSHRGRLVLLVALIVFALISVGLFFAYQKLQSNIGTGRIDVVGDRPIPEVEGALNILVLGSDSRDGAGRIYGPGYTGPGRSDTAVILHISEDRERAYGVSIPRDTVMEIPECKTETGISAPRRARFNEAFTIGGASCSVATIESVTGLRIDHYVVINFVGFTEIVDALGGVDVCLKNPINDRDAKLNLQAGQQRLDGKEALGLVRVRKTVGDGGDLSRIERQQYFMEQVVRRATSIGILANPVRLYRFLDASTQSITTDEELGSLRDIAGLAWTVRGLGASNITFLTVPVAPDPANPRVTLVLQYPEADELFTALRLDQPWPTPPTPTPSPTKSTSTPSPTPTATESIKCI
jgi:LCP family protein required for cell wall assembly